MIKLRSDDSLFVISKSTIKKYPHCAFNKVTEGTDTHDLIMKDVSDTNFTTLYIDIEPNILKKIVSFMRNDDEDNIELLQSEKFNTELKRFGFGDNQFMKAGGINSDTLSNITLSTITETPNNTFPNLFSRILKSSEENSSDQNMDSLEKMLDASLESAVNKYSETSSDNIIKKKNKKIRPKNVKLNLQ